MEVISIGTAQPLTAVRADLAHEMDLLNRQGLAVQYLEENRGVYSFVDCRLEQLPGGDQSGQARVLRYYLANVITDVILNPLTREMLAKLLRARYRLLTEEENEAVVAEALSSLSKPNDAEIPRRILRRNQILAKVLRFLERNNQIILEGFLRFQLKDYYAELREAVERALDHHLLQREYREFIRLLRCFVEMQSPRIEEVNVRVKGGGMFSLLDEEGHPIEHEQLRNVLTDLGPEEIDYEDLLLSALITISPSRVVLHVIDPLEVVDTIKQVFGERVVICGGCSICGPWIH